MSLVSTGIDIQSAVVAALRGNVALGSVIGIKIFDDVPHGQEDIDTNFPRVSIGTVTEKEYGAQGVDMSQFTIEVNCYSRGLGKKGCQEIMQLVRHAVIGQYAQKPHLAATGTIVSMMFDYYDGPRLGNDGKTYHGMVRFRGLIQYG